MAGGTSGSALQGLTRRFISRGSDKYINGSKIVITDVSASNGTVHAIDKVMLATGANIVASAQAVAGGGVFKTRTNIFSGSSGKIRISTYFIRSYRKFYDICTNRRSVHRSRISNVAAVSAADPTVLQTVLLNHAVGRWY
jgi:hypothetical protein